MKKLEFRTEVFLSDGEVWISDLLTESRVVELTDEQYEVLRTIWSHNPVEVELEDIRDDFRGIYEMLSKPLLARVEQLYKDYGYAPGVIELMMRNIGAQVTPVFDNDMLYNDADVVESTFEDGIITNIFRDGRKRIVGCTDVDIEVLNFDATIIGSGAFRKCTHLREVLLPNVAVIEDRAFTGCLSLRTVELSQKVKVIDDFAFSGCHFLKDINLPDSLTTIGESAFSACVHLEPSLEVPTTVTFIGNDAFAYTPLEHFSNNPICHPELDEY